MENRKYYSFCNVQNCVSGNGKPFIGITTIVKLKNPETRDVNDHTVMVCSAAIMNRTKRLANALGVELSENENGGVFCDVNFWDDRAERAKKFFGDRNEVKVCISGALSIRTWEKQDGTTGQRVTINADEWEFIPSGNNN